MASDAGYYRHPTIHGDTIVFVSEDDLWSVPAHGGTARRLTANPGIISFPSFSPDGAQLAFTGRDDGPNEVYVMPSDGGTPERLTWFGSVTQVAGWHPNGKSVLASSDWRQPFRKTLHLLSIPLDGGQPTPIRVGPARSISYEANGPGVVVGRNSGDPSRWKRYRGGTAGTLWVDRKGNGEYQQLIQLAGNLASPMWIEDRIYFLSDHEGYGNLYSVTPTGRGLRRHTDHDDYYVRFPSTDGRSIIYHAGADIYRYDVAEGKTHKVPIELKSTRSQRNRKFVPGSRHLESFDLHPQGHSLALISRGGLFTMGLWEGAVRRYGEISRVRYRLGRWLADGKRLVAVHDGAGDESLVVFSSEGSGEGKVIEGDFGRPQDLLVQPVAPAPKEVKGNGKSSNRAARASKSARGSKAGAAKAGGQHVILTNQRHELILVNVDTGKWKLIAHTRLGQGINGACWSPDGRWIAYSMPTSNRTSSIFLYEMATGTSTQITRSDFNDTDPSFDPGGKYLYFISWRTYDPIYDSHYFDLGFPKGSRPYLIPLAADTVSPFSEATRPLRAPSSHPNQQNGSERHRAPEIAGEIKIDLEGIQDRIVAFPVPEGRYVHIQGGLGRVLFSSVPVEGSLGSSWANGENPPKARLEAYDFENLKVEKISDQISSFSLSLDRQVLAIRAGKRLRVVSASTREIPSREGVGRESGWVDVDRVRVAVVPRDEWTQMFSEAWRLQRDQFWTPDMSGIDWADVKARYLPLVDRVATRSEFSDLMWEMQGELGTSHCYEMGGDYLPQPNWYQGFLGADLTYDSRAQAWKIERIPRGDSWDPKSSSPLVSPGVNIKPGDRILAIGGEPVGPDASPYERLVHLAGHEVELEVSSNGAGPHGKKNPVQVRRVVIKTLRDETALRYRDWVETNRERVHAETKGRVGYVHVPDMGPNGYSEFHRYFKLEAQREGLIVDVRFNGGGHVSQILLEKLLRRRIGYDVNRWGVPDSYPLDAPMGPLVAITNEYAGSDGDMFSHAFKLTKLGPLIGKRTWGGVVGIWPRHSLVDGAITTQPEFAFWFEDVGWGIENYGTEPDIEVEIRPQDYAQGRDPQLDRAISEMLKALRKTPPKLPNFKDRPKLRPGRLPKAR